MTHGVELSSEADSELEVELLELLTRFMVKLVIANDKTQMTSPMQA